MRRWLAAATLLAPAGAHAQRPTEGGLFSFDPDDVVVTYDEPDGLVRVHYTLAGSNKVPGDDADADGVPDYVAQVATTTREVFAHTESLGLRAPVAEDELGLGPLGGSPAFDVYLVDFGGSADGAFQVDACDGDPPRCAGSFVMENDFAGYGYPSRTAAIDTVTSHELFHAVQAAYTDDLPNWVSEGTATWAERQFRSDSQDFLRLCDAYLADSTRSLIKPPAGPVPAFAYGTALWWDFLTTRHDAGLIDALLIAASDDPTVVDAMTSVIAAADDSLADAWLEFTSWNLATGSRAGVATSHAYAADLGGIPTEAEGAAIEDDARVFSLSATYYRLDHPGGALWFGLEAAAPPVVFALHNVDDRDADGPVADVTIRWQADEPGARLLGEFDESGFWLIVSHPAVAAMSSQPHFCLGDEAHARSCAPADDPTGSDTDTPTDTGDADASSDASEGSDASDSTDSDDPGAIDSSGCGCRQAPAPWSSLLPLLLLPRRRRTHR